ncbi:unnamed protein product [Camellia sinensis]
MKFGETFMEYLHGEQEGFLDKCSHVEYKRLKKVLKSCRVCRESRDSCPSNGHDDDNGNPQLHHEFCQCEACPCCVWILDLWREKTRILRMFFSELMKEASEIAGFFTSRVRHILHLHISTGMQGYLLRFRHCFTNDQQAMVQEGRMLIEYVTMNAIAMRKILKKYDKVHSSVNGRKFKSKMQSERIELLQSPWLIELGAFYMNFNERDGGESNKFFSYDLHSTQPVMTMMLPDSVKLEYNLSCAICLELVFNPYALCCGHLFCKSCACSAASVMIFQGLKAASPESKCPVCRADGNYGSNGKTIQCSWSATCSCSKTNHHTPYPFMFLNHPIQNHGPYLLHHSQHPGAPRGRAARAPNNHLIKSLFSFACEHTLVQAGVYGDAVHMLELDLFLKKRCKEYWKERLVAERAEMVKQSKEYWDLQTKFMIGY